MGSRAVEVRARDRAPVEPRAAPRGFLRPAAPTAAAASVAPVWPGPLAAPLVALERLRHPPPGLVPGQTYALTVRRSSAEPAWTGGTWAPRPSPDRRPTPGPQAVGAREVAP